MSFSPANDFSMLVARGLTDYEVVHKFGRDSAVGSSFNPVAFGGVYQTPQPASATTLRVAAGNVNDTAAGTGAQKVYIQGLDATGELVEEELVTAGTSASAASSNSYIRLFRAYVSESGTYSTSAAGSHAADIVIESAAAATWATIDGSSGYPLGQSEIAAYTVPLGKTGFIRGFSVSIDASRPVNVALFQRQNVLDAAAPYQGMRLVANYPDLEAGLAVSQLAPYGPYPAGTDLIWMAKGAAPAPTVSINFEIWLV